jgi:hypothetical protein
MVDKLDVGKALEKLRGSKEPQSRMASLAERNRNLEEELRRLGGETRRLKDVSSAQPFKKD